MSAPSGASCFAQITLISRGKWNKWNRLHSWRDFFGSSWKSPDSNRSFQAAWFVTAEDYKRARDPASLQLITDKQHCLDGVFSIRDACFVGSFRRDCLQQQPYNYLQMMSFEEDVLGTL